MNHHYRFSLVVWLVLLTVQGWAQTDTSNYIISRTYKKAGISENFAAPTFQGNSREASSQITYFDGLGKPTQQVLAFEAGSKADIVVLTEYDNLQRPVNTFLPAPFTNNGGLLRSVADIKTNARTYYRDATKVSAAINDQKPIEAWATQTVYEASPLNRITAQKAPGAEASVSQLHGVNGDNQIRRFVSTGTGLMDLTQQGYYPGGALTWHQTTDENSSEVTEYQDRYGRTVLKRVRQTIDIFLDTYYVYDEKGQLRAVLQPKYLTAGENQLDKNAFLYAYDTYGRLTDKRVPGANAVHMTYYGTTELLETSTDGKGTVFYYKYDNLNRQKEMGIKPGGVETPLLYTYYDDYAFGPFQAYSNELTPDFAANPTQARIGLQTGSKARILKPDGTYSDWLQTVIYYDDKYRVIQTVRQLYSLGSNALERVSYKLAFDGKPEQEWTTQSTSSIAYRITKTYTYDHANRLTKTDHALYENGTQKKAYTHVENLYNEVGQLAAKSLHGGKQILTYKYTPRSWLGEHNTSNGQPFALNLTYQDNGNITSQSWATKSYNGGMTLSYDKANRLTGAAGTGGFIGYNESSINYDANGNIIGLTRQYAGTTIDQLVYKYHGNQLHRVEDNNNNEGLAVKGFINGNGINTDDEMGYDANGNLIWDNNRGISNISYNVLNLPRSVTRNGRTVQYTYDATGTKHKSEAPDNVNTVYEGAFEYKADGTLLRIALEEGQLVKDGANYMVNYYLRDHLGNVRSVLDTNGNVIQETEYYAFGLPIPRKPDTKVAYDNANKYLYNGKEKQPETEWLDYGARMYDPTIGRWMTIDPLSEKSRRWSPYNSVYSNPLRFIDPDGMYVQHYEGQEAQEEFQRMQMQHPENRPEEGNDPSRKENKERTIDKNIERYSNKEGRRPVSYLEAYERFKGFSYEQLMSNEWTYFFGLIKHRSVLESFALLYMMKFESKKKAGTL